MAIMRMMIVPGYEHGRTVNVSPDSHYGHWRRLVPQNTPLSAGDPETGWYAIVDQVISDDLAELIAEDVANGELWGM